MTDHIPADLVERLHDLAGKWATSAPFAIENDVGSTLDQCADELRALLPAPPRPTLADTPRGERASCQWMQADTETWGRAVILHPEAKAGLAVLLDRWGKVIYEDHASITPRPDLPRLEWPGDQKPTPSPAPALPEGWRLADHREYGRVVVTNPTPNRSGYAYFVARATGAIGNDWHSCDPDELTYIDQEADQ